MDYQTLAMTKLDTRMFNDLSFPEIHYATSPCYLELQEGNISDYQLRQTQRI